MIYLHIGRNKAGSTSIQDYFARHHAAMQARGVEYVLFGHMQGSVPGVAGFSSTGELAAYARRNPDLDLFLSNEFMAAAPQGFIDEAAANFKGLDVTLMAYIRDYNSWLVSGYGFDIRAGWNARDFDAYLAELGDRISYGPVLERWAGAFGWGAMRIRSLDKVSLDGGELLFDGLSALGLKPTPADAGTPRTNTAMHWMRVELTRALIAQTNETGWDADEADVIGYVQDVLQACIDAKGAGATPIAYPTPAEAARLNHLYNADVERIVSQTGAPIPLSQPPPARTTPQPPSVDSIPEPVWCVFHARFAADPIIARERGRSPPAARLLARLDGLRPG